MQFLFDAADRYIKKCDWKDLAMLKFCLFSMGLILGTQIPKEKREPVQAIGLAVFVATYVPLMAKFFEVLAPKQAPEA